MATESLADEGTFGQRPEEGDSVSGSDIWRMRVLTGGAADAKVLRQRAWFVRGQNGDGGNG